MDNRLDGTAIGKSRSPQAQSVLSACAALPVWCLVGHETSAYTSYNDTVVVCDHEWKYCPVRFGLLPDTPDSGKIASTRPLALLWRFAYTQNAKDRLIFQAVPPFSPVNVALPGVPYWQDFLTRANDETLVKAIAAAEAFYENLAAPRLEQQQKRIAELENEVRKLQGRLNVDHRYLVDTEARAFKSWLSKQGKHAPGSFARRLLADGRFEKPRYPKSWYEANLPGYGYSAEDLQTFRDLWKAMLLHS